MKNLTMEKGKRKSEKAWSSLLFTFSLLLFTFAAQAAIPQAITYRGVLARSGGFEKNALIKLTFSLYDGTNAAPVWARTIPVSVDTNGCFYAELKDDAGSVPQGVSRTSLAEALSAMRSTPEIGLTPPDSKEIRPRQKLETGVRAARAVKAKAADEVLCKNSVAFDGVRVGELSASKLTADEFDVIGDGKCTFSTAAARSVGGGSAVVTVSGVRPNAVASEVGDAYQTYTTDSSPCDMVLTYESEKFGVFSVILPKGGQIVKSGKDVKGEASDGKAEVKSMTRFAR